jgi:benzoate-CoA ligase
MQDSAARGLRDRGVRPGERVALVLRDSPQFIAAFLGAAKIGAIPVPLSTLARPDDLDFMLRDCGATLTITDADAGLFAGRPDPVAAAPTREDDMCFWQYSSGTTGAPKAVVHLHRRALFPAEGHGRHVARIGPDDRVYSTAKLFFSYGLNNSMVIPLAAGATVVLDPERFNAQRAWRLIAAERPTVLYSVPTAYATLLAAAEAGEPADTASLHACISAGEALPAPLAERWHRRFGLAILDGIGSTEIGYIAISNTADDASWPRTAPTRRRARCGYAAARPPPATTIDLTRRPRRSARAGS